MRNISKETWSKLYESASTNYEWLKPVLEFAPCKTLEIGCGSGLLSKRLSELGYDAYTNDYNGTHNDRHLVFDLLGHWECDEYDLIFSCGLLEHFDDAEIIYMLKEAAKRARTVISLVPNTNCSGYWDWRYTSVANGTWNYGEERTFCTLKDLYEKAGLVVTNEYACGNDFGNNDYLLCTIGLTKTQTDNNISKKEITK